MPASNNSPPLPEDENPADHLGIEDQQVDPEQLRRSSGTGLPEESAEPSDGDSVAEPLDTESADEVDAAEACPEPTDVEVLDEADSDELGSEVEDVDPGEEDFEDEAEDPYEEEAEFSFNQLSEAYAAVIEQKTGKRPVVVSAPDTPADAESTGEVESVDDDRACPISPESIIEAILFVGAPRDVVLTSRKIAAILRDVSPREVTKIVRQLNATYEKQGRAFRIKSDGGVLEMILDPALLDFQQEFFGRNKEVRLSQAAIDVMAIVAYNQPATKDQVEKIRGKPSGSVLAQLVRRQLLRVESEEAKPRVRYYSTTDRFLDLFQLETIGDLPQSHDVSDIAELAD